MSYPWWKFKVTFDDGYEEYFAATGVTQTDALQALFTDWWKEGQDLRVFYDAHGEVKAVEYCHCLTYGVDPESDHLQASSAPRLPIVDGVDALGGVDGAE